MADRVARILKERRKELGLTQNQVALDSGIELQSYQKFESGARKLERPAGITPGKANLSSVDDRGRSAETGGVAHEGIKKPGKKPPALR